MSLLLNKINGINAGTDAVARNIKQTFWGCEPGTSNHPKYQYHCTALPLGWREITLEEFSQSPFFSYTPEHTGWLRSEIGDARMFFMHDDTGFAFVNNYHEKTVKVFKFGCKHEFAYQEVGRCLTLNTCKHCGFQQTIDSSD